MPIKTSRIGSAPGRPACQDRSERTRQRLIEVAVEVFAELGYEGASTRTIVERAQANLVSIPYYFGSKLGLYDAVTEYIASNLALRLRPCWERAQRQLEEPGQTHEQALEHFTELVLDFARVMMGVETPSSWALFLAREQFDPSEAFEILHTKFVPLVEVCCAYIERLTGLPASSRAVRMQFLALVAMIKFTRTDRTSVMRVMGWETLGAEEGAVVTGMLRRNLQLLFGRSG